MTVQQDQKKKTIVGNYFLKQGLHSDIDTEITNHEEKNKLLGRERSRQALVASWRVIQKYFIRGGVHEVRNRIKTGPQRHSDGSTKDLGH